MGSQAAPKAPWLPLRVDGCDADSFNASIPLITHSASLFGEHDEVPALFRISFMYYTLIGVFIVFIVGYPISLLTGGNVITDERLLTPFVRSKNYQEKKFKQNCEYAEIDQALKELKIKNGEI